MKIKFVVDHLLPIFMIGLLFFLFRTLSLEILPSLAYDDLARFVYLPSGIRLLAVAIYGWIGILGIMLGWVFCHILGEEKTLLECLYLGILSGTSAFISVKIWQFYFSINNSFDGLTPRLTISLVLTTAMVSAYVRYLYLSSVDPLTPFVSVFTLGLIGDALGALIVLYCLKGALYLIRLIRPH